MNEITGFKGFRFDHKKILFTCDIDQFYKLDIYDIKKVSNSKHYFSIIVPKEFMNCINIKCIYLDIYCENYTNGNVKNWKNLINICIWYKYNRHFNGLIRVTTEIFIPIRNYI